MTIDFPPRRGGVARYLDALSSYFQDEIFVIATPEKGSEAFDSEASYKIERQTLIGKYIWPKWLGSLDIIMKRKNDFDMLIVSHVLPLGTVALIAKTWTKKPYIVFVHGMDISLAKKTWRKRWLAKRILRGANVVVANTEALAVEVKRDFNVKYTVACYPPVKSLKTVVVSPLKKDKANIILLTVSRLVPRKGHLRVLDALALLRDRKELGEVNYKIVGDGPMAEIIKQKIKRLNLENIVSLHQNVSDIELHNIYAAADIFIMPIIEDTIDREGFGMVFLEAAQYGMPSISTKMVGVNEAVINEKTGLLVNDGDIEELARVIKRLFIDKTFRLKLGQQAKKRADSFTPKASFAKLRGWL